MFRSDEGCVFNYLQLVPKSLQALGTFQRLATLQLMKETSGTAGGEECGPAMISDETLMLDFQYGSRQAFEELFARYRGPLYGFLRRRLNGDQRAEDLTQETFLAVIRGADRYTPSALVRTYLYGIAMNLLAAERRKLAKDSPPGKEAPEPAKREASDSILWVRQALDKLDDSEREILMLREYEQLSYGEIAELLKLPLNTVRPRLFRSRMALRGHLEPVLKMRDAGEASDAAESVKLRRAEGEAI